MNDLIDDQNLELFEALDGYNLHYDRQELFTTSCFKGQIRLAKFFYREIDIKNKDMGFRLACYSGNLELVKWLYQIDGKLDIHYNDDIEDLDSAFASACYSGNLELVKWIYQIDNKTDIYKDTLSVSGLGGHLKIMKWLFGLDKNLDNWPDLVGVFELSYINGYLHVAKWLIEIGANLHFVVKADFYLKEHINEYVRDSRRFEMFDWMINLYREKKIKSYFHVSLVSCYKFGLIKQIRDLVNIGGDIYGTLEIQDHKIYENPEFIQIILDQEIDLELIKNLKLRKKILSEIRLNLLKTFKIKDLIDIICVYL